MTVSDLVHYVGVYSGMLRTCTGNINIICSRLDGMSTGQI